MLHTGCHLIPQADEVLRAQPKSGRYSFRAVALTHVQNSESDTLSPRAYTPQSTW